METCRGRNFSDNGFSFPSKSPVEADEDCSELEFEFGSITPDSLASESLRNSPADHLFLNGKLLPHVFPCQKTKTSMAISGISRTPSRTSSVSSKDFSVMSSRSNSTNSRSSSSSGRTSCSDNSERSISASLMYCHKKAMANARIDCYIARERDKNRVSLSAMEANYLYGSQRWQFITPAPSLSREASLRRRKSDGPAVQEEVKKRESKKEKGLFRRFLRSFLSSCLQCHAMEPSRKVDVLQGR